jgi:hypothetical protein
MVFTIGFTLVVPTKSVAGERTDCDRLREASTRRGARATTSSVWVRGEVRSLLKQSGGGLGTKYPGLADFDAYLSVLVI